MSGSAVQFSCPTCSKKYTRKKCYETHIKMCEILKSSPTESKEFQDQMNSLPSKLDMFKLIQVLVKKTSQLEHEIQDLKGTVNRRIKNVNIIDWLNQQHNSDVVMFNQWVDSVIITDQELQFMFQQNYITGLIHIVQNHLEQLDKPCIRCFEQKKASFFVFKENQWQQLPGADFEIFVNTIKSKLRDTFQQWQESHKKEIFSDSSNIDYPELVKKILGNKLTKQQIYSRMKTHLYQTFKEDMKGYIL